MNMKEFLTKLAADNALIEKMSKATDANAAYAIAKEAGLTDSFETFVDTMKKLNDAADQMSNAEIDNITGGGGVNTTAQYVSFFSVVSGASISLATQATI